MKITSKTVMYNIEHDAQVGDLKATLIAQVFQNADLTFDVEFMNITNTSYMGILINGYDNWSKFVKFHKEMGIDFSAAFDAEFEKIFTTERVKALIS
jgi:hypothetical protein